MRCIAVADLVQCSFRLRSGVLERHQVMIPTGHSPWRMKLRKAAEVLAEDLDATSWAMPLLAYPERGEWLVYNTPRVGQAPGFAGRFPTQESAEMFMVHRAS